jgi:hypothetical protein
MGRPIKKTRMSAATDSGGDGTAGRLAVTAYFPVGGSLQQNDNSFIISQRGSKRFKIQQMNDSSTGVYTLMAVAPASLSAGEMCVRCVLNDSTDSYVERFHNRTVRHGNGSTTGQVTYTLGTEATDEGQGGSGVGTIDVI